MAQSAPARPTASPWPRTALALLAVALVAALAYIVHLQGRVAELEGRVTAAAPSRPAQAVAPAPVAPAPVAPAPVPTADILQPSQRQAMLDTLKAQTDPGRKAWFLLQSSNSDAASTVATLQQVFKDAGWPTEIVRSPYPLKAGLFLLAGDTEPAAFVGTVNEAFTASGLEVQYLTGYREFFTDRKKTPGWVGPELAADQAFTIVVGGKPK